MNATSTPDKKIRPDNLLFRSRLEICRILQALAQEQCPLSASIMHGHPIHTHLVAVDSESDHVSVAYTAHKQLNAMMLNSPTMEFLATNAGGLNFTFEVSSPEEVQIDGEPAIQFVLPKTLLMHNQREHPRVALAGDASLRCIADAEGIISFESHVTDISHDGLGCLIFSPDINVEPGAVLKGCRIILPDGNAVKTDLELRYSTRVSLEDGALVNHAGFRFTQKTEDTNKLIGFFIVDLDKK